MAYKRVPFFTWLYHSMFHKAFVTDLGEDTGKLRRYCSCGISWRENQTWLNRLDLPKK